MATQNYRLKKGYIAQFDIPFKGIKAFSNDTLTDALAAEYLRQYPSRAIYFERLPSQAKGTAPAGIKIVEPKPETKAPVEDTGNILDSTVGDLMGKDSEPTEEAEIIEIKAKLDSLGIKYHPRTGLPKLRKLLEDSLNAVE